MKKLIFLLGLIFSLTTGLIANKDPNSTKLVSGKVLDKQTGETLAGVKIQIKGTDTYCYSGMDGNFILSVNATTTSEVVINMIGYEQITLKTKELSVSSDIVLNPI